MYIQPPTAPERGRVSRRTMSRRLRWWIAASIAVHALILAALLYATPDKGPGPPSNGAEISMIFGREAGADHAATRSPDPNPAAPVAQGNPNAEPGPPSPDTEMSPPAQVASNTLPTPPEPTVEPPEPPAPAPPAPAPPAPVPTVSLYPDGDLPPPPPFVMPQAPPPLPPLPTLPRPASRRVARAPAPRPSPFAHPQNWSFDSAPSSDSFSRPSHGLNLATPGGGAREDSDVAYVSGARPSGNWGAELRKWAQARVYYPRQAAINGEDGTSTVEVVIDRSGTVLSVRLLDSAKSPFLDGAWIDLWRGSHVPPFTPDMTEPTTTMRYALHYHLIRR